MSDNNRPDYRVVAEFWRDNHKGERTKGTQEVGVAWIGETKDGARPINVVINAFPKDWDGRVTLWSIDAATEHAAASG